MSFRKVLCLCVNEQKYRTTTKFHDVKFIKMDRILNQLFQKMTIVEMRLKRFMQNGEKITAKKTKISAKTNGQVILVRL